MLAKANDTIPQTRDSFFDDDEEDATLPAPPLISSIRIVTSKPPVYRRQSQSSSSPSPSSNGSDRDVTDVSSMGGDHPHFQQRQQSRRKSNQEQHHPFHLQSMRHVLLGSSAPTSRPPSPANSQQALNKKHVRIVTDDTDQNHHHHRQHRQHHQQPYIHGHSNERRRIRLTSSAINRQKQQQKIERENLVSESIAFFLSLTFRSINIDMFNQFFFTSITFSCLLAFSSLNKTINDCPRQHKSEIEIRETNTMKDITVRLNHPSSSILENFRTSTTDTCNT